MEKTIDLKDLTPDELRKWQSKLLEILVYFRDFCSEHNLRFMLSGGTCIGAVRHHGFIPWDDDIDVAMPREDYDRLFELWDAMPNFPKMAELKWVVSTDPYFNRFPKATKPGVYFVPSEELEPHLKDAKELIKQGNSIRI